jgi:hypothetical protein
MHVHIPASHHQSNAGLRHQHFIVASTQSVQVQV